MHLNPPLCRRAFLAFFVLAGLFQSVVSGQSPPAAPAPLKLSTFDVDATPSRGSQLAYDPMREAGELTLRCRGIVLSGMDKPIVLCAVDWIGIANGAHAAFCESLAEAAGTTSDRVAVHTLHQHDAPLADFSAEEILRSRNRETKISEATFVRDVIGRAAKALRDGMAKAETVTHAGYGTADVKEVASSRRIYGPDGKVRAFRSTATKDAALRAEPVGVIDAAASVIGFWHEDKPIAVLSYYATHPQSYYRTGVANPDFPGIARFLREQALPVSLHVHFTGAAGNIGAGKYNDGNPANRSILAGRLSDGLERAWKAVEKFPVAATDVTWRVESVALPPAPHLNEAKLIAEIEGKEPKAGDILGAAMQLAWFRRCTAGDKIPLTCLGLGKVRVLHMPGELFVEYQLAAKKMRPDLKIAMAAYGDYGPGYIGTEVAYAEGGYETRTTSSFVAPQVEGVITEAIRKLLKD
ncbi:MAG TPA: hypothetical protein VHM91_04310 [Verrucomicrobiales bacterium]|jgi:hypothetical protein|nr:hypothetical protein [Verrucomicrobiales bacterium]